MTTLAHHPSECWRTKITPPMSQYIMSIAMFADSTTRRCSALSPLLQSRLISARCLGEKSVDAAYSAVNLPPRQATAAGRSPSACRPSDSEREGHRRRLAAGPPKGCCPSGVFERVGDCDRAVLIVRAGP